MRAHVAVAGPAGGRLEDITWHNTFRFLGIERRSSWVPGRRFDAAGCHSEDTRRSRPRRRPAWEVTELDLDEPKAHEVLVRVMACGLCHSDEHVREGGPYRYPMVGGARARVSSRRSVRR